MRNFLLRTGLFLGFCLLLLPVFGHAQQYCVPGTEAACGTDGSYFITKVSSGTFSSASECDNGYRIFVDSPGRTLTVSTGTTLTLLVKLQPDTLLSPTTTVTAYFDWNRNGSFDDDGESYNGAGNPLFGINTASAPGAAIGTYSIVVAVPPTALVGTTRMRVLASETDELAFSCDTVAYGEAEDYKVIIAGCTSSTASSDSLTDNAAGIWKNKLPISLQLNDTAGRTAYQVAINVDTKSLIDKGLLQPDGRDLRFGNCDLSTRLKFWVESGMNTPSTSIWVLIPSIAAHGKDTFFMHYNNKNAALTSASSFDNTFPPATRMVLPACSTTTLSGTYNYSWFEVPASSTLKISSGSIVRVNARGISIKGTVSGDGAGYAGGAPTMNGSGPGGGGTANLSPATSGGGGGYGGAGGNGSAPSGTSGVRGAMNGNNNTLDMGSGGGGVTGSTTSTATGNGGGAIGLTASQISVTGIVTLKGLMGSGIANGAGRAGGGGAGGGILMTANTVKAPGSIFVNGGNGGSAADAGGGGGGGRIGIHYGSSYTTGVYYVNGGDTTKRGNTANAPAGKGDNGVFSATPDYNTNTDAIATAFPLLGLTATRAITDTICEHEPDSIIATPGYPFYTFYRNNAVVQSGPSNVLFTLALQEGDSISVTGKVKGCVIPGNTFLKPNVKPTPAISAGPNRIICTHDTITIGGNPTVAGNIPYLLFWDGDGLEDSYVPNPRIDSPFNQTYFLEVQFANGCILHDSVSITLADQIDSVFHAVNSGPVCSGDTLYLFSDKPHIASDAYARWDGPNGFAFLGQRAIIPNAAMSDSGNYTLTLNQAGCIVTLNTHASVKPSPERVRVSGTTQLCAGDTLKLNSTSVGNPLSYSWTGPASFTSSLASPRIANADTGRSGRYRFTVTNTGSGCARRDSLDVVVHPLPTVRLGNDTTICDGQPLRLSAGNIGSTFLWNTFQTTGSIQVQSSGAYSVTVTTPQGCKNRDTIVVQARVSPVVSLGNDTFVCAPMRLTLDAGNSNAQYSWSTGATTRTIQVAQGGTYSVRVLSFNGCATGDTITVAPGVLPSVNIGNDTSVCPGVLLTLRSNSSNGRYRWNTGDTTASIQAQPGVYILQVTGADRCANSDTIIIDQSPNPVVNLGPDTSYCVNKLFYLDAGNPGSQYQWSTTASAQRIPVTMAGTYFVTVTSPAHCTGSDTIRLTAKPVATVDSVRASLFGQDVYTYVFTAYNPQHHTGSTWIFGDGSTDQSSQATHTYTNSGVYTALYLLKSECGTDTTRLKLYVNTANSVHDQAGKPDNILVYPNPARDVLNVRSEGKAKVTSLELYNAAGARVISRGTGENLEQLPTDYLPSGMYLLRIGTTEGSETRNVQLIR